MSVIPRPELVRGDDGLQRCGWSAGDPEYLRYHDEEWGREQHDPTRLFEKVCLEGFQAGLSWITILRRRPAFREVFHGFDLERIAAMDETDVLRLLADARIIRHRGKIEAAIGNARATLALDRPLDELMWSFAPPPRESPQTFAEVPAMTAESAAMSNELRTSRVPVRRPDDDVRAHAGRGNRRRPPGGVFSFATRTAFRRGRSVARLDSWEPTRRASTGPTQATRSSSRQRRSPDAGAQDDPSDAAHSMRSSIR